MQIDVGTVIYLIDSQEKSVIPAKVNEQITTKKIDGETTTHKIEIPNGKLIVLENLDSVYFLNLDELRAHLLARAEAVIDEGIAQAQRVANERFDVGTQLGGSEVGKNGKFQVTLPDGNMANVNIPEEFLNENLSD